MSDYSKSAIYRIVCDDGKFYVGSTIVPLNVRFGQHRRAVENGGTAKLYRHMRAIGGADKAHIELVADNLGISTRDELLKIEDEYIRIALKDKMCLNRNKPRATSEEREARARQQKMMWRVIARGDPSVPMAERVREYYRTHKRLPKGRRKKADPEELVSCECGVDVMRGRLATHKRTKEHAKDLARWLVAKKILQMAGSIAPERPSLYDSKRV